MGNYLSAKQQILKVSQELVNSGYLAGTGGNLSIRVRGENVLAITPSNLDYTQMNVDDVCVYTFDKEKVEGEAKPSIEMGMHIAVYKQRQDVRCVIHSHQVYASALALIGEPIPALFDEQVRFLGRSVEIVPYAPSGTGFLVRKIASALKNNHNAYILKNHGALCLGSSCERAMSNLLLLEKCALAYLLVLCTGKNAKNIPIAVREIAFAKLRADQKKTEKLLSTMINQESVNE
jgi:L-ribulose-5-phosphate 4-epimerase